MNRDKILELMDVLTAQGYGVTITAGPVRRGFLDPKAEDGVLYRIAVTELTFDKVDLKELVAIAEAHGVDVGLNGLEMGKIVFFDLDRTPEAVKNPRRHPRDPTIPSS
jgi:hypothetical protein